MACRLVGAKPLSEHICWNIVNLTFKNKLQWNFNKKSYIFIQQNPIENVVWKLSAILPRSQCPKTQENGPLGYDLQIFQSFRYIYTH